MEACLQSYFMLLRNSASRSLRGNYSRNWRIVFHFVYEVLVNIETAKPCRGSSSIAYKQRLNRIKQLGSSLNVTRTPRSTQVRALPADVVEELYEIADPTSNRNPFRAERERWRNYTLLLLYLHQGLRRSEPLALAVNAIKSDWDPLSGELRYWIDITNNRSGHIDPRFLAPSIKTDLSHRQLPISPTLSSLIRFYVDNYRAKQPHSFLFSSNRKLPLSVPNVNSIFDRLSDALSEKSKKRLASRNGVEKVTPHDCRHTSAVVRLRAFINNGLEMDLAIQNLRIFFGWSKSSVMPQHYAKAYFEERLNTIWNSDFDNRVTLLRTLSSSE
ncbi:integrase [Thalassospira tepidiphila]|uniref:Integrase n=2 Tax=Thalassospira tepidiphila TaxID=393657 RepID=A0ABX0X145_9PROT|nr:integrase [Thalassospira tepidiphila]